MCTGQHLGNACQLSSQVQRHTSEVCQRNVSHSHLPLSGKYQKKLCYHNRYLSTLQTPHRKYQKKLFYHNRYLSTLQTPHRKYHKKLCYHNRNLSTLQTPHRKYQNKLFIIIGICQPYKRHTSYLLLMSSGPMYSGVPMRMVSMLELFAFQCLAKPSVVVCVCVCACM